MSRDHRQDEGGHTPFLYSCLHAAWRPRTTPGGPVRHLAGLPMLRPRPPRRQGLECPLRDTGKSAALVRSPPLSCELLFPEKIDLQVRLAPVEAAATSPLRCLSITCQVFRQIPHRAPAAGHCPRVLVTTSQLPPASHQDAWVSLLLQHTPQTGVTVSFARAEEWSFRVPRFCLSPEPGVVLVHG